MSLPLISARVVTRYFPFRDAGDSGASIQDNAAFILEHGKNVCHYVAVDDLMISNIVGCLAVGAFVAIVLTLSVVPAVLVALDKWVVYGKKNRYTGEENKSDAINAPEEQ